MGKKKLNSLAESKASPEQIYFVYKNGIKIYPVNVGQKMFIEVDNNGKIKRFDKELKQKEVNDALAKTIIYYCELLEKTKNKMP